MGLAEFLKGIKASFFQSFGDKRKYPRVGLSVKVTNLSSGSFAYFLATNISAGGLFLKSDEPLPVGTPIKLQLSLPDTESQIVVEAEVVRVQTKPPDGSCPSGMGLKFTKLDNQGRKAIKSFVQKTL